MEVSTLSFFLPDVQECRGRLPAEEVELTPDLLPKRPSRKNGRISRPMRGSVCLEQQRSCLERRTFRKQVFLWCKVASAGVGYYRLSLMHMHVWPVAQTPSRHS